VETQPGAAVGVAGVIASAAAIEARFQLQRCRRVGVIPRGDQVRRVTGSSEMPDSSKKTSQADFACAPF
jgi:hypothetical protein